MPLVALRTSQRFMKGGGIWEVQISSVGSIHEVSIIKYEACYSWCHSAFKGGAIDEVLVCIHNGLLAASMRSEIIWVIA